MSIRGIRYLITLLAVVVAVLHGIFPNITIDGISLTLLVIAMLPWLSSLFKSIELPGGLKVEYQALEKIEERARSAGLLSEQVSSPPDTYSFQTVAPRDPNLALAGLRIELEKRLVRLAESRQLPVRKSSIGYLLTQLNQRELIAGSERALLSDMVGLLNSAVHGAEVEPAAAEWALEIGPRILKALEERAESPEIRYNGIT